MDDNAVRGGWLQEARKECTIASHTGATRACVWWNDRVAEDGEAVADDGEVREGGMDEYGCRDSNVYGGEVGVVAGEP
jgi:hypothetical protein